MTEEKKTIERKTAPPEQQRFDHQIRRIDEIIQSWGDAVKLRNAPFSDSESRKAFMNKIGLGLRRGGRASIVPANECAVELGAPDKANANMVLWTTDISLIHDGRINLVGPDMKPGENASMPYAQVVMLCIDDKSEIDPFMLESTQYLSNRLTGFMVRTVPGRLWVRISRDAVNSGMNFERLGGALIAAYKEDFPAIKAVETLFVTLDDAHVNELASIGAEAKIILGKNKKLVLVGDGEYECTDLDCDDCDEKEVCDDVRDIVILRRKRKKDAEKN